MKKMLFALLATFSSLLLGHNQYTDRFDSQVKMESDYAKVPKNTQKYYNVQAVNKSGKKLPYKISYVGGYDPSKRYIRINHKGQYVKSIDYIAKSKMPKSKN